MKKISLLFAFALVQANVLFGQTRQIDSIQQIVSQIDQARLWMRESYPNDWHDREFDGARITRVSYSKDEMLKIEQETGVSSGRLTTIIYFHAGKPIKIIDLQEDFKLHENHFGWMTAALDTTFKAATYVYNWNMNHFETVTQGERQSFQTMDHLSDYKPLIEEGQQLMRQVSKPSLEQN